MILKMMENMCYIGASIFLIKVIKAQKIVIDSNIKELKSLRKIYSRKFTQVTEYSK